MRIGRENYLYWIGQQLTLIAANQAATIFPLFKNGQLLILMW